MDFKNIKQYFLIIILIPFVSCASFHLKPDKYDYYSEHFKCNSVNKEIHLEYAEYMQMHFFQRNFNLKQNSNRKSAKIVLTGDSISALYRPHLLNRDLPKLKILNTGVGGDTTDLFLWRLNEDVLKYKPKIIIISIGGNDLLRERCIPLALENTRKIILKIKKSNPRVKIIFLGIPPVYNQRLNSIVLYYNLKLQHLIRNQKNIYYADLWEKLASNEIPRLDAKYYFINHKGKIDKVHFNESGYKRVAQILKGIIYTINR